MTWMMIFLVTESAFKCTCPNLFLGGPLEVLRGPLSCLFFHFSTLFNNKGPFIFLSHRVSGRGEGGKGNVVLRGLAF